MKLVAVHHAALWARRLAALALFLSMLRFAWAATAWAFHPERAASEMVRRERSLERESGVDAQRTAEPAPNQAPSASAEPAPAASTKAPRRADAAAEKLEVRTLFVDLGPPRSDVFVNGVRVGQTPYAGTWSCRRGDEVRIHVLPKQAAPLESRAACRDSMRAVAGRNLDPDEVAALLADPTLPSSVKNALRR